ncbi:response regulator transcription factor [Erythrobacter mangrovi]|uniref:Response regulatory domain-containing protein n=1 Tax=Erythrobacter mangrovi TaxID=2739433 RepID=A0A7D4B9W5_9SPHN|nr:hypothetical protein [Erythrobacter mangrovi]QKG70366.1 hypothetical protein HQR01_02695 [Erythrobacter mangrovi]
MEQARTLHIVGGSIHARADQVHLCFRLGFDCEIYADTAELVVRAPDSGVILAFDDHEAGGVTQVLRVLAVEGIWLPVVGTSFEPRPACVAQAIKAGALDYLRLPLNEERLAATIQRIATEADAYADWRCRSVGSVARHLGSAQFRSEARRRGLAPTTGGTARSKKGAHLADRLRALAG